ncbi:MAG: acyl-CoA synthetase [Saprospiraceae bacterium]
MFPWIEKGVDPAATAIVDPSGSYTYGDLMEASAAVAGALLNGAPDLCSARIAFLVEPGFDYVAAQWGIWRGGGVAVPIAVNHPLPSIAYVLEDTGATILVADAGYFDFLQPLEAQVPALRLLRVEGLKQGGSVPLPEVDSTRNAMILYTSGTTSKPKGVVTTHASLQAQIATLIEAWRWSAADYTLCVLPLHHVHGIVNVVCCALWSGASVAFQPKFSAGEVFRTFLEGRLTVFMAVPTIYFKLITGFAELSEEEQQRLSAAMRRLRLMVSGSAALPVSVMEKWHALSGHYLLERYGMTEIGMGISNPYLGERRAGYIGLALPGVEVRLMNEGEPVAQEGEPGEIQVRGKNVFKEYWNKPEASAAAFTPDGWFKTGDIAVVEAGYFRMLGRDSVDIIKSGGYKVSALEVEETLRSYPGVSDCCVVGIPDEEWGEVISAALVAQGPALDLAHLGPWMKERLPAYKTPRNYLLLPELPRNAMGKVTKHEVKNLF